MHCDRYFDLRAGTAYEGQWIRGSHHGTGLLRSKETAAPIG